MKKKTLKIGAILLVTVVMVFSFSMSVFAATEPPLLGGDLLWNIESIYYYVNSSASAYDARITDAAYNWCYTGYGYNNLYPNSKTTNITYSAYDIYGYSANDGANGYTTFWARTNGTSGTAYAVSPHTDDWLYCEVYLNNSYLNPNSATTTAAKQSIQATIAHEMGHVFGLNENNTNPVSIMCQAAYGRSVYTVQQVDNDAFNRKHP